MRHRSPSQTVTFRLSGKTLEELERQAREFGLSPGELSRSIVDRYLKNEEFKAILEAVTTLLDHHERLTDALTNQLAELSAEVASLRRDFNRAVGRAEPQ